jgi:hypothetical protein
MLINWNTEEVPALNVISEIKNRGQRGAVVIPVGITALVRSNDSRASVRCLFHIDIG